jgi:hypothetical protein
MPFPFRFRCRASQQRRYRAQRDLLIRIHDQSTESAGEFNPRSIGTLVFAGSRESSRMDLRLTRADL